MAWGYETDGEVLDTQGGVLHDHGQHVSNMADTFDEEASLPADVFAGFEAFPPDLQPSYDAAVSQVHAAMWPRREERTVVPDGPISGRVLVEARLADTDRAFLGAVGRWLDESLRGCTGGAVRASGELAAVANLLCRNGYVRS